MPGPRYQHTAEELRHVADILDVLNAGDKNQIVAAAGGTIDIYWSDSLIGRIDRDDETWVYLPEARRPPQRSGDITWESQDPDAIIRVEIINAAASLKVFAAISSAEVKETSKPLQRTLHRFGGTVLSIEGKVARLSLTDERKREATASCDADDLLSQGINSGDSFNCSVVKEGRAFALQFERASRKKLTPEAISEIRAEIANDLADFDIGYEVWIHSDTFVDPQEAIDHARNISKGHPLDAILAYCNASDDVPPEIHDAAAKMLNVGSLCHGS